MGQLCLTYAGMREIVVFLVCQEYPVIYANGRLACWMLACRQNTSQGMLGVLVERYEIFALDFERLATSWTSACYNRYIMNMHLSNQFQTATATAANTPGLHNNRISAQTVRNRLRENGLHARRPYRLNRLNWARVHTRWIRRHGIPLFFSDESKFSLGQITLVSTPSSMSGIVWTDDWGVVLTNFVKRSFRNGTIFQR